MKCETGRMKIKQTKIKRNELALKLNDFRFGFDEDDARERRGESVGHRNCRIRSIDQ